MTKSFVVKGRVAVICGVVYIENASSRAALLPHPAKFIYSNTRKTKKNVVTDTAIRHAYRAAAAASNNGLTTLMAFRNITFGCRIER